MEFKSVLYQKTPTPHPTTNVNPYPPPHSTNESSTAPYIQHPLTPPPAHLLVCVAVPGLFPPREHLPEQHTIAPHVTLYSEHLVQNTLGGHPPDGQHRLGSELPR